MAKGTKAAHPKSVSAEEFGKQLQAADARQRAMDDAGLLAKSARYDPESARIVIEMSRGLCVALPINTIAMLGALSDEQLAQVHVDRAATGLRWDALDMDISILGWIQMVLGKDLMRESARIGGKTSTNAKATAARANGAKGGRPRKATTKAP